MLFALLLVLLFIFFVVCVFLSAKNWHWLHITALILVFLMAIPAAYRGFAVFEKRSEYLADANKWKKEAKKAEQEYLDVIYGKQVGEDGSFGDGSLKQVAARFNQLMMNQGRVWHDCVVSDNGQDGFSLTFPNPVIKKDNEDNGEDNQDGGAADQANEELTEGLLPTSGSIIYLYQSVPKQMTTSEGQAINVNLPGKFLGTALVSSVDGATLEFKKQDRVENFSNDDKLIVYEKPSADFHGIVAKAMGMDVDKLPTIEEYRAEFQKNFPPTTFGLEENSKIYQSMLDEFSFDGRKITEVNSFLAKQGKGELNPQPENVMVEMKLLKDISVSVDGSTSVYEGSWFSDAGTMNVPYLKSDNEEGKVKIPASKEGQDSLIRIPLILAKQGYQKADADKTQIKSYEEENIGTPLNEYYSRTLRDYPTQITQTQVDIGKVKNHTEVTIRNTGLNKDATQTAEAQIARTETDTSNQVMDRNALKTDSDECKRYIAQLNSEISSLRQKIRDNYLRLSHINSETHRLSKKWAAEKQKAVSSFN